MDDAVIVELYIKRDESAISYTSEKYGKGLRKIANNVLGDEETSKECENDAYLETWNLIPPNEPRNYLFAFVGRIVRHLAIDRLKAAGAQKRSALYCELTDELQECIPGQSDVFSEISAMELTDMINSFLEEYPQVQRNIFVRRYWYFDSVSEICKRYSLTQSNVKTTLFRMREKLKDRLNRGGYEL